MSDDSLSVEFSSAAWRSVGQLDSASFQALRGHLAQLAATAAAARQDMTSGVTYMAGFEIQYELNLVERRLRVISVRGSG